MDCPSSGQQASTTPPQLASGDGRNGDGGSCGQRGQMAAVAGAAAAIQQQMMQAAARATDEDLPPRDGLAVVRIRRRIVNEGWLRHWNVLIDGQHADMLGLGERRQFYVYPGPHSLQLQPGWPLSETTVAFVAAAGEVIEFSCHPEGGVRLRRSIVIERQPPGGRIVGTRPVNMPETPSPPPTPPDAGTAT